MTHGQIAATIAYTLSQRGMSPEDRRRVAEAFADDLRLKGARRSRFYNDCLTHSEQQARDSRNTEALTR